MRRKILHTLKVGDIKESCKSVISNSFSSFSRQTALPEETPFKLPTTHTPLKHHQAGSFVTYDSFLTNFMLSDTKFE